MKRYPIIIGILLTILALFVMLAPFPLLSDFVKRLENLGYDFQLRTHVLTNKKPVLAPIAIVDIDDKSVTQEGRWPWSRAKVSDLLNQMTQQGAAVVAFDVFFSEPQENIAQSVENKMTAQNLLTPDLQTVLQKAMPLFDDDAVFAKSLANGTNILAISFLFTTDKVNILPKPLLILTPSQQGLAIHRAKGYVANIPSLQNAAKLAAFVNYFPDLDGVARRVPLIIAYQNGVYPFLALQAAMAYLGDNTIQLVTNKYGETDTLEGIKLSSRTIPVDDQGEMLIPYVGKSFTFPHLSATDVLHGKIGNDDVRDKIIFIGASATGIGDIKSTPIEASFPGVEVQATIANAILQNIYYRRPAWAQGAEVFLLVLLGLLSTFTFPFFSPKVSAIAIILTPILLLMASKYYWMHTGYVIALLIPILLVIFIGVSNIIYGYIVEGRRREFLKSIFSQYVPEKFIDQMVKMKGDYGLYGETRNMTVLFSDIRSFTTISEGMTAKELVSMLTTFFTPMTEIIFTNNGTIDKYVGDLIMAFWGAPVEDKDHASNALKSALQMQKQIKVMSDEIKDRGWPTLEMGIGLNSGEMNVGNMGSQYRRNYTVLGDAVNLGSRAEGLSKFYGVEIIATESTCDNQNEFVFRKLDKVLVKGKYKPINIFEVICMADEVTEDLKHELSRYHKALESYYKKKWDEAENALRALHDEYPNKKIYQIYIKRIKELRELELPADWDGTFTHVSK